MKIKSGLFFLLILINTKLEAIVCQNIKANNQINVESINEKYQIKSAYNINFEVQGIEMPKLNKKIFQIYKKEGLSEELVEFLTDKELEEEILALEAIKEWEKIITGMPNWQISYDKKTRGENKTLYGHPLSFDNSLIAFDFLRKGYAVVKIKHQNDKYWTCLRDIESKAIYDKVGLWSVVKPMNFKSYIDSLSKGNKHQFVYMYGKVTRIYLEDKNIYIELDNSLKIKVPFIYQVKYGEPRQIKEGNLIFIQGRPKNYKDNWTIEIKHPSQWMKHIDPGHPWRIDIKMNKKNTK